MNLIVAIDQKNGIGKDNKLLVSIPEDMKFFKEMTTGKIVIMGRNTFESFPNKKPLPNRLNIIISKNSSLKIENAIVCSSIESAVKYVKEHFGKNKLEDIFFIGGASIYEQVLPYCTYAYITKIYETFDADRFFPKLDNNWELIQYEKHFSDKGIKFAFKKFYNHGIQKM